MSDVLHELADCLPFAGKKKESDVFFLITHLYKNELDAEGNETENPSQNTDN